jgi:hypothetical protein
MPTLPPSVEVDCELFKLPINNQYDVKVDLEDLVIFQVSTGGQITSSTFLAGRIATEQSPAMLTHELSSFQNDMQTYLYSDVQSLHEKVQRLQARGAKSPRLSAAFKDDKYYMSKEAFDTMCAKEKNKFGTKHGAAESDEPLDYESPVEPPDEDVSILCKGDRLGDEFNCASFRKRIW